MRVAQFVLGASLLMVGIALMAGHRRIGARARRRRSPAAVPAVVWLVLGALLVTNGTLQVLLALA